MTENQPVLRKKMPELDSVRGIAILSVVFYHGFFWSVSPQAFSGFERLFVTITGFGWLGVNLFFVLSGFLITGILEDSKDSRSYFRKFYVRRGLRILPAFYGMLVVLAFVPGQNWSYLFVSIFYPQISLLSCIFGIPTGSSGRCPSKNISICFGPC